MNQEQIDRMLLLLFVISKSLETMAEDSKKLLAINEENREETKLMNELIIKRLQEQENE